MRGIAKVSCFTSVFVLALGCGPVELGDEVASAAGSIASGSPEEAAVLALVNDPTVDVALLDIDAALDVRAATNIIAHRDGPDAAPGTADDDLFDDIAEVDAVPYVGPAALNALLAYAQAHGYGAAGAPTAAQLDYATLALANDLAVTQTILDDDVGLDKRAAEGIVAFRAGLDGLEGTADDRTFMRLQQLDDVPYVGPSALATMRDYAVAHGYLDEVPTWVESVIFSPQPYYKSHNVAVAQAIDAAQTSLDIAMYSFSDEGIFDALEAAVQRGVSVRFLFDTASEDRKKTGAALASTRSARLEQMGIDVRWVNKIMHHKFVLIDGPRASLAQAETATVITGSGNWSFGAATKYDENTLFLQGEIEVALRLQREFNHLWDHSRDFVFDPSLTMPPAIPIGEADIADGEASHAFFTSDNFSVSGDTFSIKGSDTVASAMVAAIEAATDSIWIASGHLRSRPVSEALMAKKAAMPALDVRVYLDGQEYISAGYHYTQLNALSDCLAAAGDSLSKQRQCKDKGFLFGYEVGQAGIDVRYKFYAFRWDYSYAPQMHNKLMIIDGDELWTGSYNLSDNAEHNTFENMIVLRGLPHAAVITEYQARFLALWDTARDGSYEALIDTVNTAATIPLVFPAMALDHAEITALKAAIVARCPAVYSDAFKNDPAGHQTCTP